MAGDQIVHLSKTFVTLFNESRLDEAAAYYATDAKLLPDHDPMVVGRAAVEQYLSAAREGVADVVVDIIEVDQREDVAYEVGLNTKNVTAPDGSVSRVTGKYVAIWKRQSDGEWRMIVDTWNVD